MLIFMSKNGPVRLVSDGTPAQPKSPPKDPVERERRYNLIKRHVQADVCGIERAPLLERRRR